MKNLLLKLAVAACLLASCSIFGQIQFTGYAKAFSDKAPVVFLPDRFIVEAPLELINNEITILFNDTSNHNIYKATAIDKDANKWRLSDANPVIYSVYYPHTFTYKNELYMVALRYGYAYLYKSLDSSAAQWAIQNNGNPILSPSPNPASQWHFLWNVSVAVDNKDVFHLLAECAPAGVNQQGVGLCYSHAIMKNDLINFDANKSTGAVIQAGGNADIVYIPERNALLVLHGVLKGGYWFAGASYTYLSDDLSNAASWHSPYNRFAISEANIQVADPHIIQFPNANKLLLDFSYNQNHVYLVRANMTLAQLFDQLSQKN